MAFLLAAIGTQAASAASPETVAAEGEGAGRVRNPRGTAVRQATGDLYVADRSNFRIAKFGSAGNFLLAWGYGVADGASPELQTCGPEASPSTVKCFGPNLSSNKGPGNVIPESVAVDQASGDVYVADATNRRITKFGPTGAFVYMIGKDVNTSGITAAERDICTVADISEGDTCGRGEVGSGAGEFFTSPRSILVTPGGNIWVGDTERIIQFEGDGAYVSEASVPGSGGAVKGLGLDGSGNFYAKSALLAGVQRYVPSGSPTNALTLDQSLDSGGQAEALALDTEGNVYVGDATGHVYRFLAYNPLAEQISQFGKAKVIGTPGIEGGNPLAIDNTARVLYAADAVVQRFALPKHGPLPGEERAVNVLPTIATLEASLNPEGKETSYHFEYGTTPSYGQSTPAQTLPGTGFDDEAVSASLTDLLPDTEYHFRLSATNHCNSLNPAEECTVTGDDFKFRTLPAVAISAQWATGISAESATFRAELNPLGVEGVWWLEYGTSASYGSRTEDQSLDAGMEPVAVSAAVSGLAPGTSYHYRFSARDERGGVVYTVHGDDREIITALGGTGFRLADSRAWELVSPPQKGAARIAAPFQGNAKASEDGQAVTFISVGALGEAEGNRAIESSQSLARRQGDGWTSSNIGPAHETSSPILTGSEFRIFSEDLSYAAVEPRGLRANEPGPLSSEASERTPYLRENLVNGWRPLVTGKEGVANVPPGTKFGGRDENQLKEARGPVRVVAGSPDLRSIVLESQVSLSDDTEGVEGAQPDGPYNGVKDGLLYMWSGGHLELISRLPSSEGGGTTLAGVGTGHSLNAGGESTRHAVSSDGRYVYWTVMPGVGEPGALYVRDTAKNETIRLDTPAPGALGGSSRPVFQGASADGRRALFTDTRHLTLDASEVGTDLYECELTEGIAGSLCDLRDLTPERSGSAADVQGMVAGMSADAGDVYFVANGALTPGASSGDCVQPPVADAECTLYHSHADGSSRSITAVARLSNLDSPNWGVVTTWMPNTARAVASTSPSGRYLAFMSRAPITEYDNRDSDSGERDEEVFRYDATTADIVCVSCNPNRARPGGQLEEANPFQLPTDPLEVPLWSEQWLAGSLPSPQWAEFDSPASYQPRSVLDNGRVLFNAFDSLVTADSNQKADAYLFQPYGQGGCSVGSGGQTTAQVEGRGCVSLLSSGSAGRDSVILDSSASGNDVFIMAPDKLSALDVDNDYDVYDVRVDGLTAQASSRQECQGEACQPAVAEPEAASPASAAFSGPGNIRGKPPRSTKKSCAKARKKAARPTKQRCKRSSKKSIRRAHAGHRRRHDAGHPRANDVRRSGQ